MLLYFHTDRKGVKSKEFNSSDKFIQLEKYAGGLAILKNDEVLDYNSELTLEECNIINGDHFVLFSRENLESHRQTYVIHVTPISTKYAIRFTLEKMFVFQTIGYVARALFERLTSEYSEDNIEFTDIEIYFAGKKLKLVDTFIDMCIQTHSTLHYLVNEKINKRT